MNFRKREVKLKYIREAIACIAFGTAIGLGVYAVFLYFHIDIFGWNLGLIFAPLAAGYGETILAKKIIGEDIGAISAFILFIYTTFYSFILKNPTLGMNFITIGSIAVILQAAFPTLINYILLVVVFGIISYLLGIFKRITSRAYRELNNIYKRLFKNSEEITIETTAGFSEKESNEKINNLGFIFMTSTDVIDFEIKNLGHYHTTVILEKDKHLIHTDPVRAEKEQLKSIKKGKDECLIALANEIKENGGNGVLDLKIEYSLIGLGGDSIQVTAMGMGVKL